MSIIVNNSECVLLFTEAKRERINEQEMRLCEFKINLDFNKLIGKINVLCPSKSMKDKCGVNRILQVLKHT